MVSLIASVSASGEQPPRRGQSDIDVIGAGHTAIEIVKTTKDPEAKWMALARAGLSYAGNKLGFSFRVEGGSTLATQLEKYRHSLEGRTVSASDKLRQMASASLKVYRSGTDTRPARHEIILDYLNTMPLAAPPGYGEVNGLGEGLGAWFGVRLDDTGNALLQHEVTPDKAKAFKQVLTLLCAVRAPSFYLLQDRSALEARVHYYVKLMRESGLIDKEFAELLETTPVHVAPRAVSSQEPLSPSENRKRSAR